MRLHISQPGFTPTPKCCDNIGVVFTHSPSHTIFDLAITSNPTLNADGAKARRRLAPR